VQQKPGLQLAAGAEMGAKLVYLHLLAIAHYFYTAVQVHRWFVLIHAQKTNYVFREYLIEVFSIISY
jgi:hypothetical protein